MVESLFSEPAIKEGPKTCNIEMKAGSVGSKEARSGKADDGCVL